MQDDPYRTQRQDLLHKIQDWAGTANQAEQWLAELKRLNTVLGIQQLGPSEEELEHSVTTQYMYERLVAQYGSTLTPEQLVEVARKILNAEGTLAEITAMEILFARHTRNPDGSAIIYFPDHYGLDPNATIEEIVERALNYQPILLGPRTDLPAPAITED